MSYYLQTQLSFQHPCILKAPQQELSIIVVIPCFNETQLIKSLESLNNCDLPKGWVEIITVINNSEFSSNTIKETNAKTLKLAEQWATLNARNGISFYFINANNLPDKDAGVGLARKIGMDEAVIRFEQINKDGIIACFDADSTCATNYLVELEKHFQLFPKSPACSIHFEHPLQGNEFSQENYQAIEAYELHLRVYKNALQFCGFPFAFHTIGSSMAVKSKAYQKQGGMNKRKAGEDFYFLQKMMTLGNFSELKTTVIYPSPRVSDRVPFGTGRAMQNYLSNEQKNYTTYSMESFLDLKQFVEQLDNLYNNIILDLPLSVSEYLKIISFDENLQKIRQNST
jgi:glycosyltransferase involved in cell wall biosynthesis